MSVEGSIEGLHKTVFRCTHGYRHGMMSSLIAITLLFRSIY